MSRLLLALALFPLVASAQDHDIVVERSAVAVGGGDYSWTSDAGAVFALHGADIRFEGPPVKDAPYSADAVTETVQSLADGNKIRRTNTAKVYRDSQGRVRREETIRGIGPWSTGKHAKTTIFINDPVEGAQYVLHAESKTASKTPTPAIQGRIGPATRERREESRSEIRIVRESSSSASAQANGEPVRPNVAKAVSVRAFNLAMDVEPQTESLGTKMIEGVSAEGTRTTITIPADQVGAERDIVIVDERWRSPELGVDLMTKHSDPRMGETTYRLTDIQRGEQPLTLFQPPADYEIDDDAPHRLRLHEDE